MPSPHFRRKPGAGWTLRRSCPLTNRLCYFTSTNIGGAACCQRSDQEAAFSINKYLSSCRITKQDESGFGPSLFSTLLPFLLFICARNSPITIRVALEVTVFSNLNESITQCCVPIVVHALHMMEVGSNQTVGALNAAFANTTPVKRQLPFLIDTINAALFSQNTIRITCLSGAKGLTAKCRAV